MTLPPEFLTAPIAHRGLHDGGGNCLENSLCAFRGAVDAGFGIEVDLQLSADGVPMVFHDYTLDRMTAETGRVIERTSDELTTIPLGETADTIPRLGDMLRLVAGRVPLLIELKDQTRSGAGIGPLEAATVAALEGYQGAVALMSFHPGMVAELARIAPDIPRGLVGEKFDEPDLTPEENASLTDYAMFDDAQASFISHDWPTLDLPSVARLKARGVPVLCWTVRSPEDEVKARRIADNVTFEGYLPA